MCCGCGWLRAAAKTEKGMSKTDIIVQDYFCLLKKVCRQKRPTRIRLSRQDLLLVMADDVPYDFQALIFHNDGKNTERKMEIEALFTDDIPIEEVQKRLEQKIAEAW